MNFDAKFDRRSAPLAPTLDALNEGLAPWRGARRIVSAQPLSGGFSNSNHRVRLDGLGDAFVVRTTTRPREAVQTELDVIARVAPHVPTPSVHFAALADAPGQPSYVVLAHAEGVPLHVAEERLSPAEHAAIGRSLGETLAALHRLELPGPGLLGPGLAIATPFDGFAQAVLAETTRCLARALELGRLDAETAQAATALALAHEDALSSLRPNARLVHADCNQKNVLVAQRDGEWRVSALLDWEFAFAGSPLVDFGNFFRYEDELPPAYRTPLVEAYRASGGELPPNWRSLARVLDLINAAQFLACDAERPKTFATGRRVLQATLAATPAVL